MQFAYDLHAQRRRRDDEYNYLHLVYLGQYDNNGIWVGHAARPEQRSSVPPPDADAVRARRSGTSGSARRARATFSTRASTARFQTVWIATVGGVQQRRHGHELPGVYERARATDDQRRRYAAVYYPYGVTHGSSPEQAYRSSRPVRRSRSAIRRPFAARYCGDRTTPTTATSTGSAIRR